MTSEQISKLRTGDWLAISDVSDITFLKPLLDGKPRQITMIEEVRPEMNAVCLVLQGIKGSWWYGGKHCKKIPTQQERANKNKAFIATDMDGSIWEYKTTKPKAEENNDNGWQPTHNNEANCITGMVVPLDIDWRASLISPVIINPQNLKLMIM